MKHFHQQIDASKFIFINVKLASEKVMLFKKNVYMYVKELVV